MPKSSARSQLGISLGSDYLRACLGLLFIILDTGIHLLPSGLLEFIIFSLYDFVRVEGNRRTLFDSRTCLA